MLSGKFTFILALSTVVASPADKHTATHLPLPSAAQIQVGRKTDQASGSDAEMCKAYSVSARAIRHKFSVYRVVSNQKKHYLYQVAPCFVQGTILLHGKTFTWTVNPGGFLSTTYPDGLLRTIGTTDPAYLDTSR